jgi:putative SOS response-associated peptidase YedK
MRDSGLRVLRMGDHARPKALLQHVSDGAILTIVGLWNEWRDRINNETPVTCTMIITEANSFIGEIHDRMPVLLDEQGAAAWLPARPALSC